MDIEYNEYNYPFKFFPNCWGRDFKTGWVCRFWKCTCNRYFWWYEGLEQCDACEGETEEEEEEEEETTIEEATLGETLTEPQEEAEEQAEEEANA